MRKRNAATSAPAIASVPAAATALFAAAAVVLIAVVLIAAVGCGPEPTPDAEDAGAGGEREGWVETTSLLGKPLGPLPLSEELRAKQETLLAEARAARDAHPDDPDAIIWVGRRNAYLGRYRGAVAIYTKGIEAHPGYAKLYRHRGHRYISLRRLEDAIADLEQAVDLIEGTPDEVEPDGLPNERNIPTSTSHGNIWYHLGLAYYLKGDFDNALRAYRQCLTFSRNPDMLSATSHWLYMTLRRLGEDDEAREVLEPIHARMDIIENHDYHRLLLMYKGEQTPEQLLAEIEQEDGGLSFATTGYGVANWYLYNGDRDRAVELFDKIVESDSWAPFGLIAAEAELARMEGGHSTFSGERCARSEMLTRKSRMSPYNSRSLTRPGVRSGLRGLS